MSGLYDTSPLLWNNSGVMKPAVLLVVLALGSTALPAEAQQSTTPSRQSAQPSPERVAEAYAEYLMAHRHEDDEDVERAIASYKRAMSLDPRAAGIVSDLANLYMRLNRINEAIAAAEQALGVDPKNLDAHQVLGTVYASLATSQRAPAASRTENLKKGIEHLEQSFEGPASQADPNLRAMLSRLYIADQNYDKAIPMLSELVKQEPGWADGAALLMQAYA